MKIKMKKKDLRKIMKCIVATIPGKTGMPILQHALVIADKNGISFQATDLDHQVTLYVKGEVETPGKGVFPVRILNKAIQALQGDTISMDFIQDPSSDNVNDYVVVIKCGKTKMETPTRSIEDFPKFPTITPNHIFQIDPDLFYKMIDKTVYAVSTDPTRPALTGVCMEVAKARFAMISTDSHRLSLVETTDSTMYHPKGKKSSIVILYAKALNNLRKYADPLQVVTIQIAESNVRFLCGKLIVTVRTVEGPFPNYGKVIPKDPPLYFTVDRKEFIESIKRVSAFSDKLTNQIVYNNNKSRQITLSAKSEGVRTVSEKISAETGKHLQAGYNALYFLQALQTMEREKVTLKAHNNATAAMLYEQGGSLKHTVVIMPLRQ